MNKKRPNVIFILTDDQGPWAAGCYGNSEIHTPNIDRLASSGMRFENFLGHLRPECFQNQHAECGIMVVVSLEIH